MSGTNGVISSDDAGNARTLAALRAEAEANRPVEVGAIEIPREQAGDASAALRRMADDIDAQAKGETPNVADLDLAKTMRVDAEAARQSLAQAVQPGRPSDEQMLAEVKRLSALHGYDYDRMVVAWLAGGEILLFERVPDMSASAWLVGRPIKAKSVRRLFMVQLQTPMGLMQLEQVEWLRFTDADGETQLNLATAQQYSAMPVSQQYDVWVFVTRAKNHHDKMVAAQEEMQRKATSRIVTPEIRH